MITPTIGRVVHYRENSQGPFAAIVTAVHGENCVNLSVFGLGGTASTNRTSVILRQPEDDHPGPGVAHCHWMPYQVKKTTGSESGEKEAGVESI